MAEPTSRRIFCSLRADFGNNASSSNINRPGTLRKIQNNCATSRIFATRISLLLGLLLGLVGCKPATEPEAAAVAPEEEPVLQCGSSGELRTELYGAIRTKLEWNKNEIECSGMPRPEGQGARLRFAGNAGDGEQRIAIIIGIPDLTHGSQGDEFKSNVTVIEVGNGRFFSASDLENCLTDITSLTALDDSDKRYAIGGVLYCVSALPEVNGKSSVSVPELHFSGLIDWDAS